MRWPPPVGLRVAYGGMTVVFLASAAVQLNDPDPLRWIAAYGLAAALCGAAVARRRVRALAGALGLVALAACVGVLRAWAAGGGPLTDELGREAGGLLLIALASAAVGLPGNSPRPDGGAARFR